MSDQLPNQLLDAQRGLNSLLQLVLDLKKQIDNPSESLDLKGMKPLLPGTDLNSVKNTGTYYMDSGPSAVNKPTEMTNNSFRLVVKSINSNNIQQELITAISDQNFTRVHQFSSGNWSQWKLH